MASFATSYIPTTTATATRAADSASMTGTNFSSWFNATQGTFVVEYSTASNFPSTPRRYLLNGTDLGNSRFTVRALTDASSSALLAVGTGTAVLSVTDPNATTASARKLVASYDSTGIAITSNGATPATSAGAAAPVITQIELGQGASSGYLCGHIRSIRYYNTRLPNATLQSLTA